MALFRKTRARVRQEAADWVARLAERPTSQDCVAFRQWRDADPRHAEAYDRISGIWHQAGRLAAPGAANDALGAEPASQPMSRRVLPRALAASLVAAILVSVLLLAPRWFPGSAPDERQVMRFAAAMGEIREVHLPDGSRLVLDSGARIEAEFTKVRRDLTLKQGRARFQVAREARPFAVTAGSTSVVATGTLFDIRLLSQRTEVLLLEGSVDVRIQGLRQAPERLQAGQSLILSATSPVERRPVNRGDTSWADRMLSFDATRLDEVTAEANRYSSVHLKLGNERIAGLRLSGAFRAGDANGLAKSLAAAFNLRIIPQSDGSLLLAEANSSSRASA